MIVKIDLNSEEQFFYVKRQGEAFFTIEGDKFEIRDVTRGALEDLRERIDKALEQPQQPQQQTNSRS